MHVMHTAQPRRMLHNARIPVGIGAGLRVPVDHLEDRATEGQV
jgi:hypothetical protein